MSQGVKWMSWCVSRFRQQEVKAQTCWKPWIMRLIWFVSIDAPMVHCRHLQRHWASSIYRKLWYHYVLLFFYSDAEDRIAQLFPSHACTHTQTYTYKHMQSQNKTGSDVAWLWRLLPSCLLSVVGFLSSVESLCPLIMYLDLSQIEAKAEWP